MPRTDCLSRQTAATISPSRHRVLPAPDGQCQIVSGTSFSAAHASGLAALMLERNPTLKPDEVRAILMKTAAILGPPGPDDQFGAGEADAFAAVSAVSAPALAAVPENPAAELSSGRDTSTAKTESLPAAIAAGKPERMNSSPRRARPSLPRREIGSRAKNRVAKIP